MKKWAAFWLLGIIWGASFLLIRVGVQEVSPFQLVFLRIGIGALGLNLFLLARGGRVPLAPRTLLMFVALGLLNLTIPFTLFSLSGRVVDSGLTGVLNATAALFTFVVAHFTFTDERLNVRKLVGLGLGFAGCVVLASRSWVGGELQTSSLLGVFAILGATTCYAFGGVYNRIAVKRLGDPFVVAAGSFIMGAIAAALVMVLVPLLGGEPSVPLADVSTTALLAILTLGIVNTFIAYILFFWILPQLGASRTSMVTYVVPAVSLLLGWLVLDETIDWRLLVGAAFILSGIAVVNLRLFQRRRAARLAEAT